MKPKRSLMILIVMLLVSASAFAGYNIYRFPACLGRSDCLVHIRCIFVHRQTILGGTVSSD